jgi:hypothetical protein
MRRFLPALAGLLLCAGTAHAASGNTANSAGTATSTVVSPIRITHNAGAALKFGTFTAGTGGTVIVTQASAGSVTGDIGTVSGNAYAADGFTVTGDTARAFNISASGSNTVSNGTTTMAFTISAPASATLAAGTFALNIGGTLTVASAQAAGSYTGSYTLTVTYQ